MKLRWLPALALAAWLTGCGSDRPEFLYNTDELHKRIAANIQESWRKKLGFRIDLRNTEWKTYLEMRKALRFDVARAGWIGDYKDPNTFLELFTSDNGNNQTGWSNAEYDRLIGEAAREPDPAKRYRLLEKAEAILMDELPVVPIFFYVSKELVRPCVKGWWSTIQQIHPLKAVYREDGKLLVINNHAEVETLDPGLSSGVPEFRVQIGLYEGLLNYDPETNDPVPGVAERWEVSEDRKTYTFHLRKCLWSDGRPVRAADFEYAWKRVLDPATGAKYASILFFIKGARAYNRGEGPAQAVGIRAVDDQTLVVRLENPCAFFLNLMPFFTFYPVRRDVVEKYGEAWTRPGKHVGNGPFVLKEHRPGGHILLEKNPRYWDADRVRQFRIKFLPTQDVSTAFDLYEKGECDILTTVPTAFIDRIRKRPDFRSGPYLGTYYLAFNVTRPPFDDKAFRYRLAKAIDRETICEKILRCGEQPAYHFVPPCFPGFRHTRFDRR